MLIGLVASSFKPGLVSITFRKLSPERIVALVSQAGLRGIEWGGDVHVPHGDVRAAEEVRRLTLEAGLEVSAYGSYYRFEEFDAGAETEGPSMEAVIETAEALGAPSIRIWAGRKGSADASASWRQTVVEKARVFADRALERGMRVDFEFHTKTLTDTNESTHKLLGEIGHPNVHTLWQPYASVAQDYRLAGLKTLLDRVTNIHCFHWGPDGWKDRRLLAEGEAEWAGYLAELRKTGRERWVNIEFVKDGAEENFLHDAGTLKRWLAD